MRCLGGSGWEMQNISLIRIQRSEVSQNSLRFFARKRNQRSEVNNVFDEREREREKGACTPIINHLNFLTCIFKVLSQPNVQIGLPVVNLDLQCKMNK